MNIAVVLAHIFHTFHRQQRPRDSACFRSNLSRHLDVNMPRLDLFLRTADV